jgi:hypothetical protein
MDFALAQSHPILKTSTSPRGDAKKNAEVIGSDVNT